MKEFVSDKLEYIFPTSQKYREFVKLKVSNFSDSLPDSLDKKIKNTISSYGGKCMGFPALWLPLVLLEEESIDLDQLWPHIETSVLLSLSTSVFDDLVDEPNKNPSLLLISGYFMLFRSICNKNNPELFDLIVEEATPCIPFLTNQHTSNTELVRGEERISCFHVIIAEQICDYLGTDSSTKTMVKNAVREFGILYCLLDDILDSCDDFNSNHYGRIVLNSIDKDLETIKKSWEEIVTLQITKAFKSISSFPIFYEQCKSLDIHTRVNSLINRRAKIYYEIF